MKFEMNNIEYTIKEVSQQEYKELRVKEDEYCVDYLLDILDIDKGEMKDE